MKAARIHQHGSADILQIEEVDIPSIAADEVLVKVIASAINPLDRWIRDGNLKDLIPIEFPHTLGWDFAGSVVEVGTEVCGYSRGDAVYSRPEVSRNGSHAEYIAVPAKDIAHKPRIYPSQRQLHCQSHPLPPGRLFLTWVNCRKVNAFLFMEVPEALAALLFNWLKIKGLMSLLLHLPRITGSLSLSGQMKPLIFVKSISRMLLAMLM
ncbi:MAG: alcohol dehydrogenase catalytic domain-containing protein [Endozoicomonas sp.]|uniref:alcohol dehydrogenase catalytic domain-containing protein n=1 Tax=Endozoicomonas sp. TaxID=1892382 RepID=UPI003D9AD28F